MKSFKVCLISLIVFISCQQNEYSLPDESLQDVPFEQNNELSIPLYTRNQIENDTGSISPDIEFLKEIRDYLSQDSEFLDAQHQLVENYGKLYWSHAVLDVTDESTYLMCLPFIKYEEYSGLLIITGHGDHVDLNFVDVYTLKRCIRESTITSDNFYLTYALTKLSYLEYIRNNRVIKSYVDALHEIFNFSGIELELRSEINVSYWSEGPGQLEDGSWALVAKFHEQIIPCNGGGGGAGGTSVDTSLSGDGPAGGSSGNTDNNDENDESDEVVTVEDLLDDLSIDDDCVNLLSNEAVLQARELLSNMTFPCDDRTDEEILSDILNALCDESGVNSGDADSLLTNIDINVDLVSGSDLSDGLDGYDWIKIIQESKECENKTLEELCPKLKDILDKFVGSDGHNPNCSLLNSLGTSNIKTNIFLDCDKSSVGNADGSSVLGRTRSSIGFNDQVNIAINPDLCDESCAKILSVLVHESIHARMIDMAINLLPEGFNSDAAFMQAYRAITDGHFNGNENSHVIIARFFTEEYAKAMHEMTGIGKWEDYLFWAYEGLGISPSSFMTIEELTQVNSNWNKISEQVNNEYKC